jgi:hypothetical protein
MRGKRTAPPRTEPTKSSAEDAEWVALGIHIAFLCSSQIYKAGVRELWRIERMNLHPDDLRKAKLDLDRKITNRIEAEVGPLMPSRSPDVVANEAFYGVFSESLKIAQDDPEKIRRAYSLGLVEFDAEHRFHVAFQNIANDHFTGSRKASDQYLRLIANNQLIRYGDGLPPIKGNLDHRIIMKNGLDLGLKNLSASNLALFYDRFCPCFEVHDSDDLRKLRKRILEEGRLAREKVVPKFTGSNQQVG